MFFLSRLLEERTREMCRQVALREVDEEGGNEEEKEAGKEAGKERKQALPPQVPGRKLALYVFPGWIATGATWAS